MMQDKMLSDQVIEEPKLEQQHSPREESRDKNEIKKMFEKLQVRPWDSSSEQNEGSEDLGTPVNKSDFVELS